MSARSRRAKRRANAERNRLLRQRQRDGVVMACIPISLSVSEMLLENGYLLGWDVADRKAVSGAALAALEFMAQQYQPS